MTVHPSPTTTRRRLNYGWRFRDLPTADLSPDVRLPWLPATVPGHVHLDLIDAGVLQDPFHEMAERAAQWVDETDWVYETTFHLPEAPAAHSVLVFQGLDTVAEIELNDTAVGTADNMFVAHEFAVASLLKHGQGDENANHLRVTFRSALRIGRQRRADWRGCGGESCPADEWSRWGPRAFMRKAQYMYGWDWGPVLASCGIWQSVDLVQVPVARLLDWSYSVAFQDDGSADLTITQYVDRAPDAAESDVDVRFELFGVRTIEDDLDAPLPEPVVAAAAKGAGRVAATATLHIEQAELWWPNRHNALGEGVHPALYDLRTTLLCGGDIADERTSRVGLRTIELIREKDLDGAGESFKFRVNGHDIFIRGANWIPNDSFPSRLQSESAQDDGEIPDTRVHNLIWDACDAGYNMLRIWGGGLYESEHFYDLCDEHGILVWQDFPYACSYYPDTGIYADAARAEAAVAVRRLRSHASLAIWCGNNENDSMYYDRWPGTRPERFLGEKLYHELLPAVVAEEDPGRPYWPSSPWGGDQPGCGEAGDRHNWRVWHGGDWTYYAEDKSRFVSEFGFAASCSLDCWASCLDDLNRTPESAAVFWHDKTRKSPGVMLDFLALHYPSPRTLEEFTYLTQLNQADALTFGVEHYRRMKGYCWGTLFWQINDCWPTISWAVIDSLGEPLAAHFASKRFFAPVIVSAERDGDTVSATVVNDRLSPIDGRIRMQLLTFDGEILAQTEFAGAAPANAAHKCGSLDVAAARGRENSAVVLLTLSDASGVLAENVHLLAEPKDLALPDPELTVSVSELDAERCQITVEAKRFALGAWLSAGRPGDGLPPSFSDNYFWIPPGGRKVLTAEMTAEIASAGELSNRLQIKTLRDYLQVR